MLTADLAFPYSRGGVLRVVPLAAARREEAVSLVHALLETVSELVGHTRDEVEGALEAVMEGRDDVVARGLLKMVEDLCRYEQAAPFDPAAARAQLFSVAAAQRAALGATEAFDRTAVVAAVARELGLPHEELERGLYADLRAAHRLVEVDAVDSENLFDRYEFARAQAVLLRATQMRAKVAGVDPATYRALFRRLKFHQLLFELRREEDGYLVEVEGPAAQFVSPVRYGLRLALALPLLAALPICEVAADVRWGAKRERRTFQWSRGSDFTVPVPAVPQTDDISTLLERMGSGVGPWRVTRASELLHLPGTMVCVPDLRFTHEESGQVIYLELLGLWSREAVWRRVELVERGLSSPVIFAVNERLRVSERALGAHPSARLLVYKGRLSAASVVRALEAIAASTSGSPS
ncbi:MAG: DUF790 family protein, partial [Myxococcota bacterium]